MLRDRSQAVVSGAVALVIALWLLVPLTAPFFRAVASPSSFSVLAIAAPWVLLAKTIATAAAVCAVAATIGVPLGALLGRFDVPGRSVALVVHVFPTLLPPLVLALGFAHLARAAESELLRRVLFSDAGVIAVLAWALCPIVTVLTALGVRAVDASFEEAARVVASPRVAFTKIVLPLARPPIAAGLVMVFALAASEIGVPTFLRVRAYPEMVFARLGGAVFEPGEACALALPLIAAAAVVLASERWATQRRSRTAMVLRVEARAPLPLCSARYFIAIGCWAVVLTGLVPIAALVFAAASDGPAAVDSGVLESVRTSVITAAAVGAVIAALAFPLGHALARRAPVARVLDTAALAAFVAPAAVVSVGTVIAYDRPPTQALYDSAAMLVVGLVPRYALLGVRAIASSIAQSAAAAEEVAAVFGASFPRRLVRIVLPMHARSVIVAFVLAAVFALRDLETVVGYYPPGLQPLTVRLFTLEPNVPQTVVARIALVQVGATAVFVAIGAALLAAWPLRRRLV